MPVAASSCPSSLANPGPQWLRIDADVAGQRIDNFLIGHLKGVPRSRIYRVLRRGEVRVNKGRVKPDYRLCSGDEVRIPPLRMAAASDAPEPSRPGLAWIDDAVLYEDDALLILDKPSGLAVHGGSGVSHGLIEQVRVARPAQALELVHRLDRETSGCLLISKRRSLLRELHRLLREQDIDKRYLALLVGELPRAEVLVEAPLRKYRLRGGERMVCVDARDGKPARTRFRRLRVLPGATLVEAQPLTGRTHQIRVHAAYLGQPVAGDEKYGVAESNRRFRQRGLKRLFLHAASLAIPGLADGRRLRVQAPLPDELEALLMTLGDPS